MSKRSIFHENLSPKIYISEILSLKHSTRRKVHHPTLDISKFKQGNIAGLLIKRAHYIDLSLQVHKKSWVLFPGKFLQVVNFSTNQYYINNINILYTHSSKYDMVCKEEYLQGICFKLESLSMYIFTSSPATNKASICNFTNIPIQYTRIENWFCIRPGKPVNLVSISIESLPRESHTTTVQHINCFSPCIGFSSRI